MIKDRQDLLTTAVTAGATTQLVAQERRIDAIGKLWAAFLEIKGIAYWPIISFEANIKYATSEAQRKQRAEAYLPIMERGGWLATHNEIHKIASSIELHRPLLGEHVWLLFWFYEWVLGSAMLSADPTVHTSRGIQSQGWYEQDEGERRAYLEYVNEVAPAVDPDTIVQLGDGGLRRVLDQLEGEMLREIQFLLSGAIATQERIEQAQRLSALLAQVGVSPNI